MYHREWCTSIRVCIMLILLSESHISGHFTYLAMVQSRCSRTSEVHCIHLYNNYMIGSTVNVWETMENFLLHKPAYDLQPVRSLLLNQLRTKVSGFLVLKPAVKITD